MVGVEYFGGAQKSCFFACCRLELGVGELVIKGRPPLLHSLGQVHTSYGYIHTHYGVK